MSNKGMTWPGVLAVPIRIDPATFWVFKTGQETAPYSNQVANSSKQDVWLPSMQDGGTSPA